MSWKHSRSGAQQNAISAHAREGFKVPESGSGRLQRLGVALVGAAPGGRRARSDRRWRRRRAHPAGHARRSTDSSSDCGRPGREVSPTFCCGHPSDRFAGRIPASRSDFNASRSVRSTTTTPCGPVPPKVGGTLGADAEPGPDGFRTGSTRSCSLGTRVPRSRVLRSTSGGRPAVDAGGGTESWRNQ